MYKHYIIDKTYKSVMVCGDLHGLFNLLKYKIREYNLTDSLIIIAGDCGFGYEKDQYYRDEHKKMLKVLTKQNVQIMFVRGNHDDKSFFDGERINFERFIAIPDYSVISFFENETQHNILCVGGAISIDRRWSKKEESKYTNGKRFYWIDEFPIYEEEILNEIKNDGLNIDIVVTHSSPDFVPLIDKAGIENFIFFDSDLIEDINNERLTLTKLYDHLLKKDKHHVKLWCYGHFHQHMLSYSEEGVKFMMLDMFNNSNNSWDMYQIRL